MSPLTLLGMVGIARRLSAAVLMIACLATLAVAGWLAAQTPTGNPTSTSQRQPAGLDIPSTQDPKVLQENAEKLRDEAAKLREESTKLQTALDGQRREADGFRWLLTVVLGLGAVYSLFQAIYSYLNVQELKGQAQKTIESVETLRKNTENDLKAFQKDVKTTAEEDFRKFRTACEMQFPMFVGFETSLARISSQLEARLRSATMGDNFYRTLNDLERQEIYYYEKSAASLEFVEVSSPGRLFHIYRGFCRFYVDKYRADRTDRMKGHSVSQEDRNDLIRARYFLYRTDLLPGDKDFRVLNERGRMAAHAEAVPDYGEARTCFEQSAILKENQQCAHYNLAIIDHVRAMPLMTSDPSEAKKLLNEAVKRLRATRTYSNWEDSPLLKKGSSIDYNLACGLSRLAELEHDPGRKGDLLKESFEALKRAVIQAPGERDQFEGDRQHGGDLHELSTDPRFQPKLDEFASTIRKAQV